MAVTPVDIKQLETFADRMFGKVGIDVEFTHHFLQRANDERNDKEIMPAELKKLKKLRLDRHGITDLVENASSLLSIYRDGW